jgi:hypothetical protein
MNWQTHAPNIFGVGFNVTLITKDVRTKAEERQN